MMKDHEYIVSHLDDTLIHKSGKKIPGTSWRRDPLGPSFHTNFIWGQRFIQVSLATSIKKGPCQSRSIPIGFHHCPGLKKPNKKATPEAIQLFKEQIKVANLSAQGIQHIQNLRKELDQDGYEKKKLITSVDGGFTNKTVLRQLPHSTCLIGRIRKDAKLFSLPDEKKSARGRKRKYGDALPTPEKIRQSDQYPTQSIDAWAAGKVHNFKIKVIHNVKWRSVGQNQILTLIIIKPLGYRLAKGSALLFRDPAYLISTDSEIALADLLQFYIWRWEIEVNFRDEKTLFGCGESQVRNPVSVSSIPAFITAIYGFLHLSMLKKEFNNQGYLLPKPKWDQSEEHQRPSTMEIINLFRLTIWTKLKNQFCDFVKNQHELRSMKKEVDPMISSMFYCRK
jgi:DDE superfamily endonuclease